MYYRLHLFFKRKFIRVCKQSVLDKNAQDAHQAMHTMLSVVPERIVFSFLNKERAFFGGQIQWDGNDEELLWLWKLNSFEYMNQYTTTTIQYFLLHWIAHNTNERAESWDPFVISKRIVNWVQWIDARKHDIPAMDEKLLQIIVLSLYGQLQRLSTDIEHDIQANHLFENYKALLLGSLCLLKFTNPELDHKKIKKQFKCGLDGLCTQLRKQILPDGAHYERSPMYHAIVMEGVLQIRNALQQSFCSATSAREELRNECEEILPKMELWLSYLTHPDGKIALFHDSAFDGVPVSLRRGQTSVDKESMLLKPSDYFFRRWNNGNYFVLDCGEPSPSYQPGHTHCSALSYELSLDNKRVIVDSGCGSYQNQKIRKYCRSTAAHNVPMIEGYEQSEIWASFRMGRRVRICHAVWKNPEQKLNCMIQDYLGNVFSRLVQFAANKIVITDTLKKRVVAGKFCSVIHLAPEVASRCVSTEQRVQSLSIPYYPEFGMPVDHTVICLYADSIDTIQYTIGVI